MLKHGVLACLTGSLFSLAAFAAADATPPPAQPQLAAATAKAAAATAEAPPAAQKKAGPHQPSRDLRYCLQRTTNAAVIRCAESRR